MTKKRSVEMPMQTRLASVGTIDIEKRTVEIVWTTGAQVRRYDWFSDRSYMEELSLKPEHVDLARLNSGAPFLDVHSFERLSDVIGVVEKAWLGKGEGRAIVRFSKREEVESIFQDVQDGILRNISVGYNVYAYNKQEREGQLPVYTAQSWEPIELSLVPIGADAGAGVRSEESNIKTNCVIIESAEPATTRKEAVMDEKTAEAGKTAAEVKEAEQRALAATQAAMDKARNDEKQRHIDIRDAVRMARIDTSIGEDLINKDVSIEQARKVIIEKLADKSAADEIRSSHNSIQVIDNTEQHRGFMEEAILHRCDPRIKLSEGARQFRGLRMIDLARDCIELAGGKARGLSPRQIAQAALDCNPQTRAGMQSTSDFPVILANVVTKTLRQAYELSPRTFTQWARPATAPDFKTIARVLLSDITKMEKVEEGGEYKYLKVGDGSETYNLAKYGGIIAISWEAIINDDLDAFARLPASIAEEASALESDIVYAILMGNPTMGDSLTLFHASHGNLAGSGTVINATNLATARAAMRRQLSIKGRALNITPDFLIVGPELEGVALQYTSADFVASQSVNINPKFNTQLTVIVEPRITGTNWFLSTTPNRVDTVEYAHLEGEEELFTETRWGFEVDGMQIKARDVFAAKAIDFRGLYKNPGA